MDRCGRSGHGRQRVITILDGYPDDVLALSATDHVTRDDCRDALIPEAEVRMLRHQRIRFFFCVR